MDASVYVPDFFDGHHVPFDHFSNNEVKVDPVNNKSNVRLTDLRFGFDEYTETMDSGSTNPSQIFEPKYLNIRELEDCTQTHPNSWRNFYIFLLIAPQLIVPWTN